MPRTGKRGLNFHDARGRLVRAYPFAELREDALAAARRLIARGVEARRPHRPDRRDRRRSSPPCSSARSMPAPGRCRCRCRPRSAARESYIDQLGVQLDSSDPQAAALSRRARRMAGAAAEAAGVEGIDWESVRREPARPMRRCPQPQPDDIAYLQYSSGSTRFPHGVVDHPPRRCSATSPRTATAWRSATATAASPGCPSITTWAWSAACCRRSPTRCRPTI